VLPASPASPASPVPANEFTRLLELASFDILDTPAEAYFDELTHLVAQVCETPMAAISISDRDRQWLKARYGLSAGELARDNSFCSHAILGTEPLQVEDTTLDPRFSGNALVTGPTAIRFYAGVPLYTLNGFALGTLCVLDQRPRQLTPSQLLTLRLTAAQVVQQFELRKVARSLRRQARLFEKTQSIGHIGGWELNVRTYELIWTDETYRIHGVTRENYSPTLDSAIDFYTPASVAIIRRSVHDAIQSGTSYDIELQIMTRAGKTRWVRSMGQREEDDDAALRLFGIIQDIDDRRTLEGEVLLASRHEQTAIGAELHDGLGQDLAGISMMLHGLANDVPAGDSHFAKDLRAIEGMVRDAVATCRTLSLGISPVTPAVGGLHVGLRSLTAKLARVHAIRVDLDVGSMPMSIPEVAADNLYRLVQEALRRAIINGAAKQVVVTLRPDDAGFHLSITDDGSGMDKSDGASALSLRLMRYRARLLGACLEIVPQPSGGTSIVCHMTEQALHVAVDDAER